jgi:hypothetical protein
MIIDVKKAAKWGSILIIFSLLLGGTTLLISFRIFFTNFQEVTAFSKSQSGIEKFISAILIWLVIDCILYAIIRYLILPWMFRKM